MDGLLHRDGFVDLVDVDSLSFAVCIEAEVDGCCQNVTEDHEQHGAGILPADGVVGEIEGRDVRVPEPFDQQPVQEQEEDDPSQGD